MSNPAPHPRLPRRRRWFKVLLGLVVIAVGIVVAGFFLARRQIGELVVRQLGERLAMDGVFITWKSADWLPDQGARVHGLALYRDAAKQDRLALFKTVTVSRGDPSWLRWDKVIFKTVDTPFLLGSGECETKLEHMDMVLFVQPGKIDLREWHASLQGLRIELKGAYEDAAPAADAGANAASIPATKSEATKSEATKRQATKSEGLFSNVNLDWLKPMKAWVKFQPENEEPVLRLELHSLPAESGRNLTMKFDGARFRWRGQKWDYMQTAMEIPVGRGNAPIEIDHVRIGHEGQKVEIAAAFDPANRVIHFSKFDSGIDLLALTRALFPDAIGGLSAATTSGTWRISGTGEIPVDRPEDFRWQGDAALDGDLVYASGGVNIALQKPSFSVHVEPETVSISELKAGLWGGSLRASKIQIHPPSKEKKLRVETQFTLSGSRPQLVRKSFTADRKQAGEALLDWKGAWRVSGAGAIPIDHPENFKWNGDVALDGELAYVSDETHVALQKPSFSVRLDDQLVSISDFKAGLWDGVLSAPNLLVYLPSPKRGPRFETQVSLAGARLESIIDSFGSAQTEPGVVQCDWKGSGEFDLASLTGSGALSIDEAKFCRMPILGPLHLVFEKLTPHFRKDVASSMTVNHRIAGGILYLDDLKLVSEQVRVESGGTIDLAREYAEFTATGRLRKIKGLATVLLTSLLEFKGEGAVDEVHWSLNGLPSAHLTGKAASATTKVATEALKVTGRALKGLIELPGKLIPDK